MQPDSATGTAVKYLKESEEGDWEIYPAVHAGKGSIQAKYVFKENLALDPLILLLYRLPPGASEGPHSHCRGVEEGTADELYYIVSGSGEMEIDGRRVEVNAGDSVFVPQGVVHGIENTSATTELKVYLTVLVREPKYFADVAAREAARQDS